MEWEFRVSEAVREPDWDAFVDASPCGHYSQTCAWAELKATQGWAVLRLLLYARDGGMEHLFGGGQILYRRKPPVGLVGYLSKGPLFLEENAEARTRLLDEITALCRRKGLFILAAQPPDFCHPMSECLKTHGFASLPFENICPPGTAIMDLTMSPDEMLAAMCKNKRRKIRTAFKQGVTVRCGAESDIPAAHALMLTTGNRKQFCPPSLAYMQNAWRILQLQGKLYLFIAEHEGQPLSVMFALRQGEMLTLWKAGWSGEEEKLFPNNALYWGIIEWAKAQGLHWLDLGSLNTDTAREICSGNDVPREAMTGVDVFKMEFKGQVVFHPETMVYLSNGLLRWLLRRLAGIMPAIMDLPLVEKCMIRLALNA